MLNLKIKIKLESVIIITLVGFIGYQGLSMYKVSKNIREIEGKSNNLEISQEDFHSMPNLLTVIPEKKDIPSFIVRGDNVKNQIAFNDYINNNIYKFDGYDITGASKDLIINDYGLFVISKSKSSIDNIAVNSFKPSVISSVEIENLEEFIGQYEANGLIFIKTTENDVVSYNYKNGQTNNCDVEGKKFSEIYNKLGETGDVLDFCFVNDIEVSNEEKANGIYISFIEDSKMIDIFYRYYPENNCFKEIDLNIIKDE